MTTREFAEKLGQEKENNLELLKKFKEASNNPEAVYAIAKEAGVTDSFEEFKAETEKMYEAYSQELSEEELLAIAGGQNTTAGDVVAFCVVVGGVALFFG